MSYGDILMKGIGDGRIFVGIFQEQEDIPAPD